MIDQKDVTIIVPHLLREGPQGYALSECYKSLLETFEGNIILAFNGPNEDSLEGYRWLNDKPERVKILLIQEQGQCKAVNAAVAMTNTPWVFVTNDDMIYAPDWFSQLTEAITDPSIRCISPKLVEPRPGAPTFDVYFCGGAGGDFVKDRWLSYAKVIHTRSNTIELRTGFNLPFLIKRELWDLIGGYDVNYDPWGSNSDSDLEYKIKLAGVQPHQNPNAVVYHFSQTSGTFEPKNGEWWGKNWEYFKKKWGFERTDKRIWEADFEIPGRKEGRIFIPWWQGFYS